MALRPGVLSEIERRRTSAYSVSPAGLASRRARCPGPRAWAGSRPVASRRRAFLGEQALVEARDEEGGELPTMARSGVSLPLLRRHRTARRCQSRRAMSCSRLSRVCPARAARRRPAARSCTAGRQGAHATRLNASAASRLPGCRRAPRTFKPDAVVTSTPGSATRVYSTPCGVFSARAARGNAVPTAKRGSSGRSETLGGPATRERGVAAHAHRRRVGLRDGGQHRQGRESMDPRMASLSLKAQASRKPSA